MKKFPKKAKLITDGGFYKIIKINEFRPKIIIPLMKRVRFATPETLDIDMDISLNIEFQFERATKTVAFYRQSGVVNIIK